MIKNIGKSRPEKSRDPGIWQNPVPKNPGIEILDPVRAWSQGGSGSYQGGVLVISAWVTLLERPKGVKGDVQQT